MNDFGWSDKVFCWMVAYFPVWMGAVAFGLIGLALVTRLTSAS